MPAPVRRPRRRWRARCRSAGDDLNARPVTRPGELLEAAPGLSVTQHSGEGKANQYFLRGFNLDHGTDLAISVDDMPINLRTHAHGQGYADLNFLMPETVNSLDIRKGPFFADVGDFGNAGSLAIGLKDTSQRTAGVSTGSFGYERLFEIGSTKALEGNLLVAAEAGTYNGPWVNPDDMRKFSGMMRYSQGTATDGLSVTAMAYSNKWNSSDQVPLRAIASEVIPLYGELDPSDGGDTSRLSLSARIAQSDDAGSWKANAYVIRYTLDLYNDFEWDTPNGENSVPQLPCGNADSIRRRRAGRMLSPVGRPVPSARRPRLRRRQRFTHLPVCLCRPADRNHVRRPDPLRRHQPRADGHRPAHLHRQYPLRQGRRGQRRHLRGEHNPLDALAAHHARVARRLFRRNGFVDL